MSSAYARRMQLPEREANECSISELTWKTTNMCRSKPTKVGISMNSSVRTVKKNSGTRHYFFSLQSIRHNSTNHKKSPKHHRRKAVAKGNQQHTCTPTSSTPTPICINIS